MRKQCRASAEDGEMPYMPHSVTGERSAMAPTDSVQHQPQSRQLKSWAHARCVDLKCYRENASPLRRRVAKLRKRFRAAARCGATERLRLLKSDLEEAAGELADAEVEYRSFKKWVLQQYENAHHDQSGDDRTAAARGAQR